MSVRHQSFGRVFPAATALMEPPEAARRLRDGRQKGGAMLAVGNLRSYGDSCLNSLGTIVDMRSMNRVVSLDPETGILEAEAGVMLPEIIAAGAPHGFFPPVVPGTQLITLGGAIANDVHGKNHHAAGSFGCHVRAFELLRSDGERRRCSPQENPDWFAATIGGLGLTGLIVEAELQLRRIAGPAMTVENTRFADLDEFFALNAVAEERHEYTVAWVDCLAARPRGWFMAGNHAGAEAAREAPPPGKARTLPLTPPVSLVNGLSLRAFNPAYFHRPLPARATVHYVPYFYPLDGLLHWNRMYGPRGFYQYQCVLPATARAALDEILQAIAASGQGSFLAVLKTFGARASPGLLSFPMPGSTLALDFPNRGEATRALFGRLDAIVAAAGGRLYAAKDARMPGALFRRGYPALDEFIPYLDPKFASDFWRRILEQE